MARSRAARGDRGCAESARSRMGQPIHHPLPNPLACRDVPAVRVRSSSPSPTNHPQATPAFAPVLSGETSNCGSGHPPCGPPITSPASLEGGPVAPARSPRAPGSTTPRRAGALSRIHPLRPQRDSSSAVLLARPRPPARDRATLRFELARRAGVTLRVSDVSGRAIAALLDGGAAPGTHAVDRNTRSRVAGWPPGACWVLLGPDVQLRRTRYDLERAAERIRATHYPLAEEFAREVLQPPSEQDMLELFAPAKVR